MSKINVSNATTQKGENFWNFLQSYYMMYNGLRNNAFTVVKDKRFNSILALVKADKQIEDLVKLYYKEQPRELFEIINEFKSKEHFLKWLQNEIRLSKFLSQSAIRENIKN